MNERIRKFREKAKFTQEELANQLNISVAEYSQIENGKQLTCELAKKIADILDINILKIIYDDNEYNLLQKKLWFIDIANDYTEDIDSVTEWYNSLLKGTK